MYLLAWYKLTHLNQCSISVPSEYLCFFMFFYVSHSTQPISCHDLFFYPRKTLENLWFSDIFRMYRKRWVAWNRLWATSGSCFFFKNCKIDQWHHWGRRKVFNTFLANVSILYTLKNTKGFLMFLGDIEWMGSYFNPLTTNVLHHIETSQLNCIAN